VSIGDRGSAGWRGKRKRWKEVEGRRKREKEKKREMKKKRKKVKEGRSDRGAQASPHELRPTK
jgi:hypothetical protein